MTTTAKTAGEIAADKRWKKHEAMCNRLLKKGYQMAIDELQGDEKNAAQIAKLEKELKTIFK